MMYGLKEGKSSGRFPRQQILLSDSKEALSSSKIETTSHPENHLEIASALGMMDIGKLAGSRTKLEAVKVVNEVEQQEVPFQFQ